MSRVRGGANSTEIRVSSGAVRAFVGRIDILIALDRGGIEHVERRISRETVVLAEEEVIGEDFNKGRCKFVNVPFTQLAAGIGNRIYSNIVAVGAIAGLFGIESEVIVGYVKRFFFGKSGDVVRGNAEAAKVGYEVGVRLVNSGQIEVGVIADLEIKDEVLLSGAEAVGLGAIAGGCNFISAYPMSPSTGVLTFLARHGEEFGVIAEQAEDEIAAMNMAIGVWYAGGRGMVSTSGGGFALMSEGLSLAGMLELPMVIHLAQRPGPATGLATRTEQADLELALYAGHGEFPRIILAPGTIEEAIYLTAKAFNLADKYQVPVFVLTDQYLMDSYYNLAGLDLSEVKVKKYLVETEGDYKRYEFSKKGISPRGVPGFGDGLVVSCSDEHGEDGHMTEEMDLRTMMVDKRLKKIGSIRKEVIQPELTGSKDYRQLVVCWGSTYHIVNEAVKKLGRSDVASLHFKQVYPLPAETLNYLKKAEKIVMVENNATSQFGRLIRLYTGIGIEKVILKYNGLSFSVEELTEKLHGVLEGEKSYG